MAGFFGLFDYNKEGPGVYLNEPPKGPFKTFFSILGRKFWKIITVNMMYVVMSIPVLIVAWLVGTQIFTAVFPGLTFENFKNLFTQTNPSQVSEIVSSITSSEVVSGAKEVIKMTPEESAAIFYSQISLIFSFSLVGLQLFVFGPVHAGITYIFRNYAREEHAFIWGDFKDHFKRNWKQSLVTAIIGFAATYLIAINFSFYSQGDVVTNKFLTGILTGGIIVISILFTSMQMYIYPMMVTFNLTFKQLYKNSILLTMAKLPFNIGIMLLSLLITMVIPLALVLFAGSIGIVIVFFYYIFFAFGMNMMLTNFFVYRQLQKYMIDPMSQTTPETSEEEPIFSDTKVDDED